MYQCGNVPTFPGSILLHLLGPHPIPPALGNFAQLFLGPGLSGEFCLTIAWLFAEHLGRMEGERERETAPERQKVGRQALARWVSPRPDVREVKSICPVKISGQGEAREGKAAAKTLKYRGAFWNSCQTRASEGGRRVWEKEREH